jgi:hypothetical protein
VLIGYDSKDVWLAYRRETDPHFFRPIEKARASLRVGHGVRIEDCRPDDNGRRAERCRSRIVALTANSAPVPYRDTQADDGRWDARASRSQPRDARRRDCLDHIKSRNTRNSRIAATSVSVRDHIAGVP